MFGFWTLKCAANEPSNFNSPPTVIAGMNFGRRVLTTTSSCGYLKKARCNVVHCNGQPLNCNFKDVVLYLGVRLGEDLLESLKIDSNSVFTVLLNSLW